MIVKVQRPLASTIADPPVLVYDQYRRCQTQIPMTDELRKRFGDKVKFYCTASPKGPSGVILGQIVPDRGW
jgi:hypothetical protein